MSSREHFQAPRQTFSNCCNLEILRLSHQAGLEVTNDSFRMSAVITVKLNAACYFCHTLLNAICNGPKICNCWALCRHVAAGSILIQQGAVKYQASIWLLSTSSHPVTAFLPRQQFIVHLHKMFIVLAFKFNLYFAKQKKLIPHPVITRWRAL